MIKLKYILQESQIHGAHQDADLYAQYHKTIQSTISQFLSKKYKKQPWRVADFSRVKKIWQDYARMGIVRDENGIDDIIEIFTENYLKLACNTMLTEVEPDGNMARDQSHYFKQLKLMTEKKKEKFWASFFPWIEDKDNDARMSDFAIPEIGKQIAKLRQAKTYDEKLLCCDALLNIIHPRGGLANWFVDGGALSLDILAGKGM